MGRDFQILPCRSRNFLGRERAIKLDTRGKKLPKVLDNKFPREEHRELPQLLETMTHPAQVLFLPLQKKSII